jgi:hypothetical protein
MNFRRFFDLDARADGPGADTPDLGRRRSLLAPLALWLAPGAIAAAADATFFSTTGHSAAPATGALAEAPASALPPVFPIRSGDLHGLIDRQGRVLLPAEFTEVLPGDPLILVRKGYKTAFFDYRGGMVIAPQNAITKPFSMGVAPAVLGEAPGRTKYGYVDAGQQIVIPAAYDDAEPFVDGLAVVGIADAWGTMKYGALNRDGKLVLPAIHEKLLAPSGGVVRAASRDRPHRIFDLAGRDITPADVDFIGIAAEGMVRIWSGRKQGFMSVAGQVVVPPRFDMADEYSEGMSRVYIDGRYGFIDTSGRLVIEPRFVGAEKFSDGLALVTDGETSAFIDKSGAIVLRPEADRTYPFTQGLAVVKVGAKYGYIDKSGGMVITPRFSFARPFRDGLAYVTEGRSGGYIGPDGMFVWLLG